MAEAGDEDTQSVFYHLEMGMPFESDFSVKETDDFIDDKFSGLSPVERSRPPPKDVFCEPKSFWD